MAPPGTKVALILGHSFVRGAHDHAANVARSYSPQELARHFQVHHLCHELHFHGQRGAMAITDSPFPLSRTVIRNVQPDFVILDLGTNDLALGKSPLEVAVELLDIAKILIANYRVKHVTLCSIINRASRLSITTEQFATAAYLCNKYLMDLCEVEARVHFHMHKGFWSSSPNEWSRDGIHPNNPIGRKKYRASLRKAVFKTLQNFTVRSAVHIP